MEIVLGLIVLTLVAYSLGGLTSKKIIKALNREIDVTNEELVITRSQYFQMQQAHERLLRDSQEKATRGLKSNPLFRDIPCESVSVQFLETPHVQTISSDKE